MLALVPLASLGKTLSYAIHVVVGLGCLVALFGLLRRKDCVRGGANLAIGLCFLFLWGLTYFGTSISFVFGDVLAIGFWIICMAGDPLRWDVRWWIAFMACSSPTWSS